MGLFQQAHLDVATQPKAEHLKSELAKLEVNIKSITENLSDLDEESDEDEQEYEVPKANSEEDIELDTNLNHYTALHLNLHLLEFKLNPQTSEYIAKLPTHKKYLLNIVDMLEVLRQISRVTPPPIEIRCNVGYYKNQNLQADHKKILLCSRSIGNKYNKKYLRPIAN